MGTEPRIVFRVHAIRRMLERQISVDDVRQALETGDSIEEYPPRTFPEENMKCVVRKQGETAPGNATMTLPIRAA
jgi:hypothetical protein